MNNPLFSQHIVLMGVCGCGKTTIGNALSNKLQWMFYDGDSFHIKANIEKMRHGFPLTDKDRVGWLETQRNHLLNLSKKGISSILACSALTKQYRNILANPFIAKKIPNSHLSFIWLRVNSKKIKKRLSKRKGHFMNPNLIESQFNTLEIPNSNKENIPIYEVDASPKRINIILQHCLYYQYKLLNQYLMS